MREMTLNIGLDESFDNMKDWKIMRKKIGEVNSAKLT
jgi:hypothetical protein